MDDKIQIHPLYKDIIAKGIAYGAERWIMELQRISERFAAFYIEKIPDHDTAGGHTFSYYSKPLHCMNTYMHFFYT